jgi:CheY-like chemotaxis protein
MRLEIESTVTIPPLSEQAQLDDQTHVDLAEAKSALNQGIKAAQAGNRALARTSLRKATGLEPRNESAWLWLASISDYPEELLGFLNHVLEINPENQRAVEWKTATHALLSKTFVQRGIDASQENQKDFATECFQTALDYDEKNATAWMWMASLSDSNAVKIGLLEKAIAIEPENGSAIAALAAAKGSILKDRLTEAKTAAVSGNNAEAIKILDALLATNADSVEAWTMKSYLADGFDEKIRCFESILAIDPENLAAKSGRDSLLSIFGRGEAANTERTRDFSDRADDDRFVDESRARFVTDSIEPSIDKSPTQDLEMPAGVSDHFQPENDAQVVHTETHPEEEHDYEPMETGAEPFDSLAEETPESPSPDAEQLTAIDEPQDFSLLTEAIESPESYPDSHAETIAISYETIAEPVSPDHPAEGFESYDDETSSPSGEFVIPMPESELPGVAVPDTWNSEPSVEGHEALYVKAESYECPFCSQSNEPQSITCQACMAVLTLSDLELLLANQSAHKLILRQAVEEIERKRAGRELGPEELTVLGLGHLNLRNLQLGYACLSEASRLSPNNVILAGQVNALLIRLEEIKQQEEAHLKMPRGKSILVVDDSATVRKLIAGKLEKSGHDVICANDGVEAMERLDHFIPDLILLDITMPRMDGYQVCKNIRSKSSTKDVPVVMISGKDGFFDKVRGRMAGTTGYITKPFGPETLMKAVEMYLHGEFPESDEV